MKLKSYFYLMSLALCAIMTGCGQSAEKSALSASEYFVLRVIDGDTIELANGKRVRYIGIDTPEVRQRRGGTWQYSPEKYALEAKRYNERLVGGKRVKLEFDVEKEDKYGRWLAYVYVDGKMVNAELLRQGYATLYTFPPNVKYVDFLLKAQKDACQNKRGLWKAPQVTVTEE